jgi:hypothetical protein
LGAQAQVTCRITEISEMIHLLINLEGCDRLTIMNIQVRMDDKISKSEKAEHD